MEESHYRALLNEVHNDIEQADQAIEEAHQAIAAAEESKKELATLETYLQGKVDGGGNSPRAPKPQATRKQGASNKKSKPAPEAASDDSGQGMQTVEFGPDGFPST